jgi:hypothetical protein
MNCTNFKLCCALCCTNDHYEDPLQFLKEMVHNQYGKKMFEKKKDCPQASFECFKHVKGLFKHHQSFSIFDR